MDPAEQRASDRKLWEGSAQTWAAHRDVVQQTLLPVSEWMVDAIAPQPGHVVLELGAGTGDTGLLAAELVAPGGKLISTDGAEAMVAAAREEGERRGITNAEFRPMELEWIDLPTASVDAVLCRFALMLVPDPDTAAREIRRVLKPGATAALAVWDAAEHNPWSLGRLLTTLGHSEPSPPDSPGPFRLGDAARLDELLAGAGLFDVCVEPLEIFFRAPAIDALWDVQSQMSPTARKLLPTLSPAEHYALRDAVDTAWKPYVAPDGSIAVPGRVLCASASG